MIIQLTFIPKMNICCFIPGNQVIFIIALKKSSFFLKSAYHFLRLADRCTFSEFHKPTMTSYVHK